MAQPEEPANKPHQESQPWWPAEDDPRLKIPEELQTPAARPPPAKPARADGASIVQAGRAWAVAMTFIFTILAGAFLGWLFDGWRGTTPTGALIGLALGFVLAFVQIVRATQKQERLEADRKRKGPPSGG
jgi:F0F1-type ATP synthase assembly protein I